MTALNKAFPLSTPLPNLSVAQPVFQKPVLSSFAVSSVNMSIAGSGTSVPILFIKAAHRSSLCSIAFAETLLCEKSS